MGVLLSNRNNMITQLNEMGLKFIVREKSSGIIVAAFQSSTSANNCLNNNWNRHDYEVKEAY